MHGTYIMIMCFFHNNYKYNLKTAFKYHENPQIILRLLCTCVCQYDSRLNTNKVQSCRSKSLYEPNILEFSTLKTALPRVPNPFLNLVHTVLIMKYVPCFLKLK